MTVEHVNVLIVGAGLSGIGAAYHLKTGCPSKSYAILEGRHAIGGTWDLFRYPGIRSDSDMYTLGYRFKPWTNAKAIADGSSIRTYVRETAREHGIDRHIRFGHMVKAASWSTGTARWTVTAERNGAPVRMTCDFLFMCSGYYSYEAGYTPDFEGIGDFGGDIIHPQKWPDDIDYADKKVVVIGSGATAVTLVPELAKDAGHVVMLQRSPTYMVSRPSTDKAAIWLRGVLPGKLAYALTRWKNVLLGMFFYRQARTYPAKARERLVGMVRNELGPDYDVATHFVPAYNPWDQRLCLVPDSDFFQTLKSGSASIETGHIDRFEPAGIRLKSGKLLEADMVVTATGLELQFLGGLDMQVDGRAIRTGDLVNYKGMMYSDLPNLAAVFGYTNASWTLKADLTSEYVCRLLNHMDRTGARICTPRLREGDVNTEAKPPLSSGYFARAISRMPKQGSRMPWQQNHNYLKDLMALRFGAVDDGAMEFSRCAETAAAMPAEATSAT